MCSTSGWNCTPYMSRSVFSKAATGAPAEAATTAKPGGAAWHPSPCDIHTCCSRGSPRNSMLDGSVTRSGVPPYSEVPVRATSPPSAWAISWKP